MKAVLKEEVMTLAAKAESSTKDKDEIRRLSSLFSPESKQSALPTTAIRSNIAGRGGGGSGPPTSVAFSASSFGLPQSNLPSPPFYTTPFAGVAGKARAGFLSDQIRKDAT
jgi:hypothetical protein